MKFKSANENNTDEYLYFIKILVPTVVLKYLKDTYDIKRLFLVR
nr:MAG TPA: hypothetical protein [Bacteriophage sp.]